MVVLEGLEPFLIRLEFGTDERTRRDLFWEDSMGAETSITESRSKSLAADSEDKGLRGGGARF